MEKGYPLILVFYLDRELMQNPQIIKPFYEMVNAMIAQKEANVLAFFIPTDGEERIECINPVTVAEADMERVNKIIEEIKTNFHVGDDTLGNITTEETLPCGCVGDCIGHDESGPCECGGNCKCNDNESEV